MNSQSFNLNVIQGIGLFFKVIGSIILFYLIFLGIPIYFKLNIPAYYVSIGNAISPFVIYLFIRYLEIKYNFRIWKNIIFNTLHVKDLLLILFIVVSIIILIIPFTKPITFLKSLMKMEIVSIQFTTLKFDLSRFINAIGLYIMAPIFEEMFLKGIILREFLKKYSVFFSIIITSVFFACGHIFSANFLAYFIWGIISGFVYYKTESILYCILIHVAVNIYSDFIEAKTMVCSIMELFEFTLIYLGAIILASFSIRAFHKNNEKAI